MSVSRFDSGSIGRALLPGVDTDTSESLSAIETSDDGTTITLTYSTMSGPVVTYYTDRVGDSGQFGIIVYVVNSADLLPYVYSGTVQVATYPGSGNEVTLAFV